MDLKLLAATAGLTVKKYSPEILTAVGIVTFIGTIVVACKQTTKAGDILDEHKKAMDEIKEAKELADKDELIDRNGNHINYSVEEVKSDKIGTWSKTGVEFGKLYLPVIALGTISLSCFLVANRIMKTRYLGAVAAFNALSDAFDRYRERVREDGGVDLDRRYMYGTSQNKIDVVEVDENGKQHKHKEIAEDINSEYPLGSPYAKFFDESCPDWDESPEINGLFLKAREAQANKILNERGHLFLNEVYDLLGIQRTSIGALVGWVKGLGDDKVSFGLENIGSQATRRFVNGLESVVLLDFNVDGIMYNKI